MPSRKDFHRWSHHRALSQPTISLALTALSLLLLVLVLLSVPGPIKGLFWFSVDGAGGVDNQPGQGLSAGVLGWCMTGTSNCTYAPLSDNPYLATMIDVGQALTVRIMLPAACYWLILTLITWILLTILTPIGYRINDLDSISRHLGFAIVESCVLCISLFGNVLIWLAFGLGRMAFESVKQGGGRPRSGRAMETTAVAATISLISLLTASWGLYLRLSQAQQKWKREAVMVRRRSMAAMNLSANQGILPNLNLGGGLENGNGNGVGLSGGGGAGLDGKRGSFMRLHGEKMGDNFGSHHSIYNDNDVTDHHRDRKFDNRQSFISAAGGGNVNLGYGSVLGRRWSDAPDYTSQAGVGHGTLGVTTEPSQHRRESVVRIQDQDEEKLASREDLSSRATREQEMMIRRASVVSADSPYAAAANGHRG